MIYLQKNKSTYIDIYTNQKKGEKKEKKKKKKNPPNWLLCTAVRLAQYNCESRKGHEKAVRAGPF